MPAQQPAATSPPAYRTSLTYSSLPLDGLVCLLSPPHRVSAGESGIPALQRDLHSLAIAYPISPGASHSATHCAHEHVRTCAVHAGGHAPAALAGAGRNRTAAYLAAGSGHSVCRHGGQYPLLFRDWGRPAYPLSAPPVPAGSAVVHLHLLPPGALLVGTGPADRGRFSDRIVRQPAVQVRARRQPELRRRDPSAPTGDPADCDPLSG